MDLTAAAEINRALKKSGRLHRAAQSALLGELGLHPGQDVLLWVLAQAGGGMSMTELAARMGVEAPTVTKSLARLEAGGWCLREPVPGDRRRVRAVLTDRARGAIPAIEAAWERVAASATARLTAAEQAQLVHLLGAVTEGLLDMVDSRVLADED